MGKNLQSAAAREFAKRWEGKGYEKGESQPFWLEFLQTVLGVERPYDIISFENQVKLSSTSFIDAYIEPTHVLIEQKSIDKDLRKAIPQSDGSLLTPFQQAKRYAAELPYSRRPRWMVISNFRQFHIYDMENPQGEPEIIELKNLETEYYRLQFLVDTGNEHLRREMEVSLKAGEIIGEIYDELLKQYESPIDADTLKSLNVLCVRLVFCLYAEDAGVFGPKRNMFHDYLSQFRENPSLVRQALINMFEILNTPKDVRDKYIDEGLGHFPYCNGGLFAERKITVPFFSDRLVGLILDRASDDFDWSQISPTIFGALFESTLNPVTRRGGGMHYTSIENIHKVIDPLFLDDLKEELAQIKADPVDKSRTVKAKAFQDKLSSLKFLDPACGSGNFLTESYLSLRRLENEAIQIQSKGQMYLSLGEEFSPIKVDIHQFYGIEINDFAVSTATTAMWIAESQMMAETEKIMQRDIDFLPLKPYRNIVEGNALRMDWSCLDTGEPSELIYADRLNVIRPGDIQGGVLYDSSYEKEMNVVTDEVHFGMPQRQKQRIQFDYIIGNPPFVGYSLQSKSQKEDIRDVFIDGKGKPYDSAGKLDYVAGWYFKAAQLIAGTDTKVAFVSTNSITQGEQVALLWKPLEERFKIAIDFAWRTFKWDSESSQKAHVYCVVIGFSCCGTGRKMIFDRGSRQFTDTINAYLVGGPDVFIESRRRPLCQSPLMYKGSQPTDGGHFFLTPQDRDLLISKYPDAARHIRRFLGAEEFINNKIRYCLWLEKASPSEIKSCPPIMERIRAVRDMRLASSKEATRESAKTPTAFQENRQPDSNYILVPRHSSEARRYIPLGFISPDVICGDANLMIPDATIYHFGILTSNVHMAWMRAVCGRLKSDYRYSANIVYNNFPWPTPTVEQKAKIENTAQAILDTRAKYQDCSLADLYDEVTMPADLRRAHQENDCAVMAAYGMNIKTTTESSCVATLFDRYEK